MLFMVTFTGEPGNQKEALKRAAERKNVQWEGVKVIGRWIYPGAHKAFALCEANDVTALVKLTLPLSDLGHYEIVPVIEVQELVKMMGGPSKDARRSGPKR